MNSNSFLLLFLFMILFSCSGNQQKEQLRRTEPVITDNGKTVSFSDAESAAIFKTEKVVRGSFRSEFTSPAKVAASIVSSVGDDGLNIVLFDNPELSGSYSQYLQNEINIDQIKNVNIRQKEIELERIKDLQKHGTATGRELLEAETELAVYKSNLTAETAALIEHKASLIAAGFSPEILQKSKPGMVYLISDIPENLIGNVRTGSTCEIVFSSFPEEKFRGRIDAVAGMVDNVTRMVKVRIGIGNPSGKLKAGMYADVTFDFDTQSAVKPAENQLTVSNSSLVTIQGKHYVFRKNPDSEYKVSFDRTEINISQQFGDRVVVMSGLNEDDEVATEGVMQLKGLSFGY